MRVYPMNLSSGTVLSQEMSIVGGQSVSAAVKMPVAEMETPNSIRIAIEFLRGDPNDEAQWVQEASVVWSAGNPLPVLQGVAPKHSTLARVAVALGRSQQIEIELS